MNRSLWQEIRCLIGEFLISIALDVLPNPEAAQYAKFVKPYFDQRISEAERYRKLTVGRKR